jgi:hypothetical protein
MRAYVSECALQHANVAQLNRESRWMMIPLGALERVDLRSAWTSEAQHFTPWLASEAGLRLLGDTIGIELEREAEEQAVGPFRADILARRTDTPDEHWVLIENQLEATDHRHLGQLLTYAAGLDAVTIIWVAAEFTQEHRAALDWLNDITDDRFEFFGLEVELWRIGPSPAAPKFNVVCSPNNWRRSVKKDARQAEGILSPVKQLQQRYWEALKALLDSRKGPLRARTPPAQHWTDFSIGRAGAWLTAVANTRDDHIRVELNINGNGDRALAKQWFAILAADKSAIEKEIGVALVWRELPEKLLSQVALRRDGADPSDETDWTAQHAWLADTLERFRAVFRPRLVMLPGNVEVAPKSVGELENSE